MIDLDALFAAAFARVCKNIDRRALLAQGKPAAFANRSVGQRYRSDRNGAGRTSMGATSP